MNERDLTGGEGYTEDLTWREQEILLLLAEHLTNREIGDRLHLAESTVKDYVSHILSKLYVKNRRQAVERARTLGLLETPDTRVAKPAVRLPAEPTRFLGRLEELAEVGRLLNEGRLLTLAGPGGIGKTRLALKAAQKAAPRFEDGVFFVSLAPIGAADHLPQTVAEALKFPVATQEDPQQQLLRYLKRRQLLLVMDNFEHLLDGAGLVSQILQEAPGVKVLVTSRERLNLLGETTLYLGGMAISSQDGEVDPLAVDAVALFVQSGRRVVPEYTPTPADLNYIIEICQSVQGMPLAIELAASWLQLLNVAEIGAEIERGLDFLAAEVRDAPERHRSIRAVFEHSWSLLPPSEREIFKKLAVFRGGCTRLAAQQVTGASLQQLANLANKSLLSHDPNSSRLEIHELLRQYAQEQLEKTPSAHQAAQEGHAAFYAAFMRQKWQEIKGEKQLIAIAEIQADIENVRNAWRYYQGQKNASQMWSFVNGLWYVHWMRGWNLAGMRLFEEAARIFQGATDEEAVSLTASIRALQGFFMSLLDLSEEGYELTRQAVAILGQGDRLEALVLAYDALLLNAYFQGRFEQQLDIAYQMLEYAVECGDKWLIAFASYGASLAAIPAGDYTTAQRHAESNLAICEEIGDAIGSTQPLIALGHLALIKADYEAASASYRRCWRISKETGFYYGDQTSSKYLGKVTLSMGHEAEAERYLKHSLTLTKEMGFVRDIINLLYEFGRLRAARGDLIGAAELLALVIQHPLSAQSRMLEGPIRKSAQTLLAELEDELPPEVLAAALARGRELDLDEVVAEFTT